MTNYIFFDAPTGVLYLAEKNGAVTHLAFSEEELPFDREEKETPLLRKGREEIEEYFSGSRKTFELPLAPQGTAFQTVVWEQLLRIPYGETRSYKQVAEAIGCPNACRAVGMANNRNPIALIIPCHRVIGANGELVGYGGGIEIKKYLLALEKQNR